MTKDNSVLVLPVIHPPLPFYRGLLHIIGLAVAYVIAGKLSYFATIPPGYASAIWPPAGVALAAMLVYGYRIWPGVMLGALMVNGLIPEVTSSISENLMSALITLGISSGATLQALSGAYVVKRFTDYPNGLIRAQDIFRFWLMGGVFSALINSTLSVTLLVAVGTTPAADFSANWATWWLGDALGIILFTPLTLVWLCQADSVWHNRNWLITLPIVLMFILTIGAAYYENQHSQQRLMLAFDEDTQEFNVALENALFTHINVLHALGSFYNASSEVSRAEFKAFTTDALDKLPGIQALGWDAVISGSQRDAYEATMKGEGHPNFRITEQDTNQQLLTAKNRPEYVPVTFIEPYQGNEKALGFDIYSNAIRREAVERARDSGELTLTTRIMLAQDQSRRYGVLAVMPVYGNGRPHQTLAERRQNVTGYLVATFKIEAIIAATLKNLPTAGLSYRLLDQSAPAAERLLYLSGESERSSGVVKTKSFFNDPGDLLSASKIAVGGRIWRLEITLTPHYIAQHRLDNVWLLLLSGLLLTCLVSAFALMASGQGRRLQLLVAQLQASKRRFDSTFNNAPLAIANLSPQGDCLEINQRFCEFIGYSHAEALTLFSRQFQHPDYHQINDEKIAQCLSGEISGFTLENQYQHKLGHPLWGKLTLQLIRTEAGRPDYFIEMIEDITARKAIEQALYKADILKNAIVNSSTFSSIATDAKGIIQIFNIGAENMLGYKADDVLNRLTPADFSDPQEVIARAKALTEELETPIAPGFEALVFKASHSIEDIYELTYIRKDGSRFPAIVSVTALRDDQQAIIGYLLIGTDNTARKQADEVIKKFTLTTLMQAEGLAKSKAQFLANMSHEIRTPMNGIIGFSELALLREMPFDIRDYLTKINLASTGLLGILNDILDLSKLDAGGISLNPVLFAVNDLNNMLNTLFIDSAEKKGLGFSIEVGAGMPKNLIGDELRLQQVLVNLLGNAIKFTVSGSVSLSITLLESDSLQARILCCVKDTGIGMSVKGQSKLFQLFSQADDSITRRFGGTGLGLVLSNKLVQLMGGEFMVESMPGLGSRFSFELVFGLSPESFVEKIELPSATFSSALQEFGRELAGIRILVAEDNLFNQQIIREFLGLSGISVEIANNGEEALAFLEQSQFDAVLMDIHMPVMDGFEATRQIRNQPRFATLPIIALTAGVTEEERGECLAAGMSDFISKPINSSKLLSTLVNWVKSPSMTVSSSFPKAG